MSAGEAAIQTGIQAQIQALVEFADADVVINDWGVLDGSTENAPYVIISNADTFNSKQDTTSAETSWEIPVSLFEKFDSWPLTENALRDRRQALIDKFNAIGNARSAGGLMSVSINGIRNEGPITPYYGIYLTDAQMAETLPVFLFQTLIFSVEEF